MPLECKVRTNPELLLFVCGYGVLAVEDIDDFKTFFNIHLKNNTPFKVFFDLRQVKTAQTKAIHAMASCMVSFEELAQNKVVATSVLIDSITIENLIKLLFSFRQPSTPTKVTSDLHEACNFLDEYQLTKTI